MAGEKPGFRSVLPRVFAYRRDLSREDAFKCVTTLNEVEKSGFAITEHMFTLDGHVTLWLTDDCAHWLLEVGDLSYLEDTTIGGRR